MTQDTSRRCGCGYFDDALLDLEKTLRRTARELRQHADEFDTIVGTGFSGGVIIPALALRLKKSFVLIRKETDDSHHGKGRLIGEIGKRWIFVDDFTSSGRTRRRVIHKVWDRTNNDWDGPFETEYIGSYYYSKKQDRWTPALIEPFVDPKMYDNHGDRIIPEPPPVMLEPVMPETFVAEIEWQEACKAAREPEYPVGDCVSYANYVRKIGASCWSRGGGAGNGLLRGADLI